MSIINRTKKGFTLIEVCVVFAILIIVIGIIYPFFSSNTKVLSQTEARSDLQREGQYAIKCLTDRIMESQRIIMLKGVSGNIVLSENSNAKLDDSTTSCAIELAAPYTTTDSAISYCFTFKDDNLFYRQKTVAEELYSSEGRKVAGDIKSIEFETIDGKSFGECKGLSIKITLRKNQIDDYVVESKVYLRNSNGNN